MRQQLLQRKITNSSAVHHGIQVKSIRDPACLSRANNKHAVGSQVKVLFAHGDAHLTCCNRASSHLIVFDVPMTRRARLENDDVETDILGNGNRLTAGEV